MRKLTCLVCVTNPSTLKRERARTLRPYRLVVGVGTHPSTILLPRVWRETTSDPSCPTPPAGVLSTWSCWPCNEERLSGQVVVDEGPLAALKNRRRVHLSSIYQINGRLTDNTWTIENQWTITGRWQVVVDEGPLAALKNKLKARPKPYTLHPTPYTLQPTPYILHPTPFTLRPEP